MFMLSVISKICVVQTLELLAFLNTLIFILSALSNILVLVLCTLIAMKVWFLTILNCCSVVLNLWRFPMAKVRAMSHTPYDNDFSKAPAPRVERSTFNLSHRHLTTIDSGWLIPIFTCDASPGDTFDIKTGTLARLTTPVVPFMDGLKMDIMYFSVPNRLLWDNWEKFNGYQENPGDSIDFTIPTIVSNSSTGFDPSSIYDYLGPLPGVGDLEISALPCRAYNRVWNEHFRDQNYQDSIVENMGNGPDNSSDYKLLRRGKRHDYMTSALPWTQKGPPVMLPLAGKAPISGLGSLSGTRTDEPFPAISGTPSGAVVLDLGKDKTVTYPYSNSINTLNARALTSPQTAGWKYDVYADMSSVPGVSINDLRQAFQVQRLLERDARGGTRYIEFLYNHFGVKSSDARLQRSEFLGGFTTDIEVMPVAQTSSTDTKSPQGNLSAFATFAGAHSGIRHHFEEHCTVIAFAHVRADLSYQQGVPRMFLRRTRYDFLLPVLAHLGEQPIYNAEIYAQGTADDKKVFGYQERYAEYKYMPDRISGGMRSTAAAPLDFWHLSQKFDSLPILGDKFIQDIPPVSRILSLKTGPEFTADFCFKIKATRPLPVHAVPGYVDHY